MGNGKRIKRNGKLTYEHKEVMENYLGRSIEKDEVVHHIDGNPFNNNIDNLELLTRGVHTTCHFIGIKNPSSKLTESDVLKIRELYKNGYGCRKIANIFNIGKSTAIDIKHKRTWTHI